MSQISLQIDEAFIVKKYKHTLAAVYVLLQKNIYQNSMKTIAI